MCETLLLSKDLFTAHFLHPFCDLQRDRIINVRIALCETLAQHFKSQTGGGLVQEVKELRQMVKHLKLDVKNVSDMLEDVLVVPQEGDEVSEIYMLGAVTDLEASHKEEEKQGMVEVGNQTKQKETDEE